MTQAPVVTASVEVGVDPLTAFTVFTDCIDDWWVRSPYAWNHPGKAVGIRFEPGVGGRWIEVHDQATGEGFEMGRVTAWEPGALLAFTYRDVAQMDAVTEVEVRFEPAGAGTRVTVAHRGWERLDPDFAARKMREKQMGWDHILSWFAQGTVRAGEQGAPSMSTIAPYLMVADLDEAISFLQRAFGLVERFRLPGHAELDLDGATVMLGQPPADGDAKPPKRLGGVSQLLYVYVRDVDARWQQALAAGAEVIEELGDRSYGHRNFTVADPDGHQWCFAEAAEGAG